MSEADIAEMVESLTARANAQRSLKSVLDAHAAERAYRKAQDLAADPLAMVGLGEALFAARRISREEFVYLLDHSAHWRNEDQWFAGQYEAELDPFQRRLREIEAEHGLTPDQYWGGGDASAEYDEVNRQYEAVLERHFEAVLGDLGHGEVTALYFSDRAGWDRMVEIGRRLFRGDKETPPAPVETIRMLVRSYEAEADLCEAAGAFYAGCVMLGAAAEARLLWTSLEAPDAAERARAALPAGKRPKGGDPHKWTLEQLIAVAEGAGWIGELETDEFVFFVSGLADRLRMSRNLLHPGRHAMDRPLSSLSGDEFKDAKAAYHGLRLALEHAREAAPDWTG